MLKAAPSIKRWARIIRFFGGQVMLRLVDLHFAGQQILFRVKRPGVMLVIIEKMQRYTLLAQKIQERRIHVQTAETVQIINVFDG